MLSALAELHRDFVTATTNDGLAKARARGRTGGRKPALTDQQVTQAVKLHADGTPVADIARKLKASRTLYRYFSLRNAETIPDDNTG